MIDCVRDGFGDFAIDIVDTRPARGDYIMVVVGGTPGLVGHGRSVSGIAPYTGELIPRGVAFVFPENLRHDVRATCSSVLHETGHVLGLDHAYLCEDPMSYLSGCGEKRFRDVDAPCGEDEERACGFGGDTQNSYRQLARTVGLRDSKRPKSEPEPEPEPGSEDTGSDEPTITLGKPTTRNSVLTVTARASAPNGLADVVLLWATEDDSFAIPCSEIPEDVPATCTRDGDRFTFRLRVGTGARGMAAAAIDRAGNHATTDARWVWLSE
jgi:hypothetical protein